MSYEAERSLLVLKAVDEILLDYIERIENMEGAGLFYGRSVALAVKALIAVLEDTQ